MRSRRAARPVPAFPLRAIVVALLLVPVIGIVGYGLWRMRQSRGLPSV